VAAAVANQKAKTITVLSSLLAVEDDLGYIPPEAIEEVASFTKSTTNDVWGVASFYTNFRFSPPGEHTVEVCWGPTCHLLGAMDLVEAVLESLRLSEEGDTADGKVSFKYNTCLGACSQGPVVSIDHHIMGPKALGGLKGEALVQHLKEQMASISGKPTDKNNA